MHNRSLEYWAVLIGMTLYVAARHAESEALWIRIVKTGASALLAVGLSADAAPYVNGSEKAAVVVIMAFGLLALDVGTALIQDRPFIKDLIIKKLGGGRNG